MALKINNCVVIAVSLIWLTTVGCALTNDLDVAEEGLYSKADDVVILNIHNFNHKIYGQKQALIVQFYSSGCGHCKAFAPKFKLLAKSVKSWAKVVKLAVLDCSETNQDICRNFDIMSYPSLRYFHEMYTQGNENVGEQMHGQTDVNKLKNEILEKLQDEQTYKRFQQVQSLAMSSYANYMTALSDVPKNVLYTFLVFEYPSSVVGAHLILDTNNYENIRIKRVYASSELAETIGLKKFPALVAVRPDLKTRMLTPEEPTAATMLSAIKSFLKKVNYKFPSSDASNDPLSDGVSNLDFDRHNELVHDDVIYYADLENALKTSLHVDIVRYKVMDNVSLKALLDYLDVLITNFPFKFNGKIFLEDLRNNVASRSEWRGSDLYDLIIRLEKVHEPVYSTENLEYVACRGSKPKYRGYTCGLWGLFHTLTVNAAPKADTEGPKVLKAILGFVKYFFTCTECSEHFQTMAERNNINGVKDNYRAVLWLWICHNEVNLRLAGDTTEDPEFQKIQFPSFEKCSQCRITRGSWNLQQVFAYLTNMYGADNIKEAQTRRIDAVAGSPFSKVDLGLLSLLYILSFAIIIVVIKVFLTKKLHRKRVCKHDLGKV